VFGGVGKSARELGEAVEAGVRLVNVESEAELRLLDGIACERKRKIPVGLRLNPEITVDSPHAYIRTGGKGHKFGIPYDEGLSAARLAASLPWLELAGLDMHVGSQLSLMDAYERGTRTHNEPARHGARRGNQLDPVPRHGRRARGAI
jgi:diaminopimelate decarboxylase